MRQPSIITQRLREIYNEYLPIYWANRFSIRRTDDEVTEYRYAEQEFWHQFLVYVVRGFPRPTAALLAYAKDPAFRQELKQYGIYINKLIQALNREKKLADVSFQSVDEILLFIKKKLIQYDIPHHKLYTVYGIPPTGVKRFMEETSSDFSPQGRGSWDKWYKLYIDLQGNAAAFKKAMAANLPVAYRETKLILDLQTKGLEIPFTITHLRTKDNDEFTVLVGELVAAGYGIFEIGLLLNRRVQNIETYHVSRKLKEQGFLQELADHVLQLQIELRDVINNPPYNEMDISELSDELLINSTKLARLKRGQFIKSGRSFAFSYIRAYTLVKGKRALKEFPLWANNKWLFNRLEASEKYDIVKYYYW